MAQRTRKAAPDSERSLKGLLAVAIQEAVKLALIDSLLAEAVDQLVKDDMERWAATSERLRAEWDEDIFAIPDELFARMDPMALAQNVANRLLGSGGWTISGVYGGNATPAQMLEASVTRPNGSHVEDVAAAFGEHFETTTDLGEIRKAIEPEEDSDGS